MIARPVAEWKRPEPQQQPEPAAQVDSPDLASRSPKTGLLQTPSTASPTEASPASPPQPKRAQSIGFLGTRGTLFDIKDSSGGEASREQVAASIGGARAAEPPSIYSSSPDKGHRESSVPGFRRSVVMAPEEARRKTILEEDRKLGGHYSFLVPDNKLRSRKSELRFGPKSDVDDLSSRPDLGQQQSDRGIFEDLLQKKPRCSSRVFDPQRVLVAPTEDDESGGTLNLQGQTIKEPITPRSAMKMAAFPDRICRYRDGTEIRGVFDSVYGEDNDTSYDSKMPVGGKQSAPERLAAAGVSTPRQNEYKTPLCGATGMARQSDQVAPSLCSDKAGPAICGDPDIEATRTPMTRLRRGEIMLQHRGEQWTEPLPVAGKCNRELRLKAQVSPPHSTLAGEALYPDAEASPRTPRRGKAESVFSNGNSEGAARLSRRSHSGLRYEAPTQLKQNGQFSNNLSKESERIAIRQNEQMLRYECWEQIPRQKSCSPGPQSTLTGTSDLTGCQERRAGTPRDYRQGGEDGKGKALLSQRGAPMRSKKILRSPRTMEGIFDHSGTAANDQAQRTQRMGQDQAFAELVARTREQVESSRAERSEITPRIHKGNSERTAALLRMDN